MAKGHRSQIKRERNANKDTRPSAKLSYARVSVQKACFVLDAIRGKGVKEALGIVAYKPRYASTLIEKILKSAIANAENNHNLKIDKFILKPVNAQRLLEGLVEVCEESVAGKIKLCKELYFAPLERKLFYQESCIALSKREKEFLNLLHINHQKTTTYAMIEEHL